MNEAYKRHEAAALGKSQVGNGEDFVPTLCVWCKSPISLERYLGKGKCSRCLKHEAWVKQCAQTSIDFFRFVHFHYNYPEGSELPSNGK